jgi:TRAP-type C4-dicarboxylate transport system permease small subunit
MRALATLDRLLGALVVVSNNIGSLMIFAMTLGVVADVVGRYVFNAPINGTAEMVTMAVVAVLYLQLSYTLRSGRMTRSDAFVVRLVARRPGIGHMLGLLFHAAGACLAAAIMSGAWSKLLAAWREDFYVGVVGVFTFPEWPLYLIIFIGCGLTGLQFVLIAVRDLVSLRGGDAREMSGPH